MKLGYEVEYIELFKKALVLNIMHNFKNKELKLVTISVQLLNF